MQGGLEEEPEWAVLRGGRAGGFTVWPLVSFVLGSPHPVAEAAVPQGQWKLTQTSTPPSGVCHLLPHFVSLGCFTVSLKPHEADRASIIVWTLV